MLYLALHKEWHKPECQDEVIPCSTENYRTAVVQALHAQPYHNLPDLPELYTGFKSKRAAMNEKNGQKTTKEHVYPRNMTLRLDLFSPVTPLSFRDFVFHFASKGGLYSITTKEENRRLRSFHKKNPEAIRTMHWEEIYKLCEIKEQSRPASPFS